MVKCEAKVSAWCENIIRGKNRYIWKGKKCLRVCQYCFNKIKKENGVNQKLKR